jgi:hypothetical protein
MGPGKDARVDPPATAGAAFDLDPRMGRAQPVEQVVDAPRLGASTTGKQAVVIPFDVVDRGIPPGSPRPAGTGGPAPPAGPGPAPSGCARWSDRRAQHPVGMRAVKVAVGVHHLGLEPQAEGHAQLVDMGDQRMQPLGPFAPVHRPVAQAGRVVVAPPEPAVVQHEAFGPQSRRRGWRWRQGPACGRSRPLPSSCNAPGAGARVGPCTTRSRRSRWKAARCRSGPSRTAAISSAVSKCVARGPSRRPRHGRTAPDGDRRAAPRPPSGARRTRHSAGPSASPRVLVQPSPGQDQVGRMLMPRPARPRLTQPDAGGPGHAVQMELADPFAVDIDHVPCAGRAAPERPASARARAVERQPSSAADHAGRPRANDASASARRRALTSAGDPRTVRPARR